MEIEVSNGEIADKLTIIMIKLERITDESKVTNLRKEYEVLDRAVAKIISKEDPLFKGLLEVNTQLWEIEDEIRELERRKDFGQRFIETARSVYFRNDHRAELKREINLKTGSGLIEEKSYGKY